MNKIHFFSTKIKKENSIKLFSNQDFKKLLNDFRIDTPHFIIDLFKKCVKQNRDARPSFSEVRKNENSNPLLN